MAAPLEMKQDRIALDRAATSRAFDEDGHLHVTDVPLSKANVCGYFGREIPNAEDLGLKPDRLYQLLRDPDELAKAADTWNGKPLLNLHKQQSAEDHDHDLTVGTFHGVTFKAPYLVASDFHVWDGSSIAGIQADTQRELSSSYRYDADMTKGVYQGVSYDGIMRNLRCNHVAIVKSGRAGPDVVVSDAALPRNQEIHMAKADTISRQALLASGALRAYLRPKMAADARIDLTPVLAGVTGKTWATDKAALTARLKDAVVGKLARDADISDVVEMLDQLEGMADEPEAAADAPDPDETEEEKKKRLAAAAASAEDKTVAKDTVTKSAMDAAIATASDSAAKAAEAATITRLRAIQAAERDVRPRIGEIAVALDSAAAVYKLGLDAAGVQLAGVPEAAYGALYNALPSPETRRAGPSAIAMDAAATDARTKRFPNANRLSAA